MTYRPLPSKVSIAEGLEGQGLFAKERIFEGEDLGIGHVRLEGQPDGWIRTPLGGFINHSITPNCQAQLRNNLINIVALRDIEVGEELTVFYWLESYKQKVEKEWR